MYHPLLDLVNISTNAVAFVREIRPESIKQCLYGEGKESERERREREGGGEREREKERERERENKLYICTNKQVCIPNIKSTYVYSCLHVAHITLPVARTAASQVS